MIEDAMSLVGIAEQDLEVIASIYIVTIVLCVRMGVGGGVWVCAGVCVCVRGCWVGKMEKSCILTYSPGLHLELMRKSMKLVLQSFS